MSETSDHLPTSSPAVQRGVDGRSADEVTSCGRAWWRLPLLLVVVLVAIIAARSSEVRERGPAIDDAGSDDAALRVADVEDKTVSLAIDFGDGQELQYDAVAWRPKMTVDDLMTAASRRSDGFTYVVGGELGKMILISIDRVNNRSRGGNFWTYQVNDELADRSMGVYELDPGDRVLWTFGRQQ